MLRAKGQKVEGVEKTIFTQLKNHKEEEQRNRNNYTFSKQDEHYGIVSFSELWDSILMWGHYAINHTGFCVGFYESKLQDSGLFGKGGMANYEDDFPSIDPKEEQSTHLSFMETHTKAKESGYEKEYRLLRLFYPDPLTIDDRKAKLDKSFYAEVNIGIQFPKDQIKEISKLTETLGIQLYQMKQIPFKFKLTIERLSQEHHHQRPGSVKTPSPKFYSIAPARLFNL